MEKKLMVAGSDRPTAAALLSALVAVAGPEAIAMAAKSVAKKLTGKPTPESIEKRKRRKQKRRFDAIMGGYRTFTPTGRTGPEVQSSTRGDRRRAKLGRT